VPLLSNVRVDIVLLVVIGMTICSQGGIGRIAAIGQWAHPLSIIGYVLGGLILLVAASVFFGWKLPYIQSEQQALLVAILAGFKVVNAVIHSLLPSGTQREKPYPLDQVKDSPIDGGVFFSVDISL
jgi:hypothetical protein